jgi:hypothetical protein
MTPWVGSMGNKEPPHTHIQERQQQIQRAALPYAGCHASCLLGGRHASCSHPSRMAIILSPWARLWRFHGGLRGTFGKRHDRHREPLRTRLFQALFLHSAIPFDVGNNGTNELSCNRHGNHLKGLSFCFFLLVIRF